MSIMGFDDSGIVPEPKATPSNLNYNAPQDSPDRKGIAEAQKQSSPSNADPKDPQADIRAAIKTELRSAIMNAIETSRREKVHDFHEGDYLVQLNNLEALFQAHQLELLSELLGELPEKRHWTGPGKDYTKEIDISVRQFNTAIDQVVSVIEKYREGL